MRGWHSQGLALRQGKKRLKAFEVSERKQVGDIASMVNDDNAKFSRDESGGEL